MKFFLIKKKILTHRLQKHEAGWIWLMGCSLPLPALGDNGGQGKATCCCFCLLAIQSRWLQQSCFILAVAVGSSLQLGAWSSCLSSSFIMHPWMYLNQSSSVQALTPWRPSEFWRTGTSWVLHPSQSSGTQLCGSLLQAPREPALPCQQTLLWGLSSNSSESLLKESRL